MSMVDQLRAEHETNCRTWNSDQVLGDVARLLMWIQQIDGQEEMASAVYGALDRRRDLVEACMAREAESGGTALSTLLPVISALHDLQRRLLETGLLNEHEVCAAVDLLRLEVALAQS